MEARTLTLVVGAGPTARALGQVLARAGAVALVDTNPEHCAFAAASGLPAVHGNALKPEVLREAGAARAAVLVAMTPNPEVNALAGQLARATFGVPEIRLACGRDVSGHEAAAEHLGASTLFAGPVPLGDWDYWIQHERVERQGLTLQRVRSPRALFRELQAHRAVLPLAVRRGERYLAFHSDLTLQERDRIILLRSLDAAPAYYDRFDRLVDRAPVLDVDRAASVEEFFDLAAAALSEPIGMPPAALKERFLDRETASSTVIAPGLAIPHVLMEGEGHFHLLVARCRGGIPFPGQREAVHAVFVLVRSREERNFHLRALAAIAQVVQDPGFEVAWLTAAGPEALRRLVRDADRPRYPETVFEPQR